MPDSPIPCPPGYTCPLSTEAHAALDQLLAMEQTQQYNIQQCHLCQLPGLEGLQARSEQRQQVARLIKQHFPPSV